MEEGASVLMELARHAFSTLVSCPPKLLTNTVTGVLLERFEKPLVDCFPFLAKLLPIRMVQLERAYARLQEAVRRIEQTQDAERQLGFANMCYRYFEAGAKEHREIKLRILAAACAYCAAAGNADPFDVELEIFDAVERLQPFHMALLRHLEVHHTSFKSDGSHRHEATATFEELAALELGIDSNKDIWLPKALLTLRDFTAIQVEGGSGMTNREGYTAPVVEPEIILRKGKISLGGFGCKLLKYARNAFDEKEKLSG